MSAFPTRFPEIGAWAQENVVSLDEARRRFVQFVILASVASSRVLREGLIFKGDNALDFVWQPNRSTLDLDFPLTTIWPHSRSAVDRSGVTSIGPWGQSNSGLAFGSAFIPCGKCRRDRPGRSRRSSSASATHCQTRRRSCGGWMTDGRVLT